MGWSVFYPKLDRGAASSSVSYADTFSSLEKATATLMGVTMISDQILRYAPG